MPGAREILLNGGEPHAPGGGAARPGGGALCKGAGAGVGSGPGPGRLPLLPPVTTVSFFLIIISAPPKKPATPPPLPPSALHPAWKCVKLHPLFYLEKTFERVFSLRQRRSRRAAADLRNNSEGMMK